MEINSFKFANFADAYEYLCYKLLIGEPVGNTREITNVKFTVENIDDVYESRRNPSIKYMLGELVWYFAGSRDTAFISQFAPFWKQISDNGVTSNSAYGYLIQKRHAFNQMTKIIELLKKDPTSRRGVININMANSNVITTKDEPCTIALQFYIRDEKLYCTAMMRSNDIWRGLPYDIAFFTALQKVMADELGVGYGSYTHFDVSLHMYDADREKVVDCLSKEHKIVNYYIDYKKLYEEARGLYEVINKENVLDICKEKGILKICG